MQTEPLNRQHVVACLWDFDKTLSPNYMQAPLFKHFGINERDFWGEVEALPDYYAQRGVRLLPEIAYLNHILTYVRHGVMKGLNNRMLKELGAQVPLCPGLPDAFDKLREVVREGYGEHNIKLEHYILSTGIKPMILGNPMAKVVDGVFACEFLEESAPPYFTKQTTMPMNIEGEVITQIASLMDNTSKTRVIFEINKGCNKIDSIDVNSPLEESDRRIPVENMIYIADGPSDVPAFSIMRQHGGHALAVYNPERESEFDQTDTLLQNRRVNATGPTDYTETSSTYRWLKLHLKKICERIVAQETSSLNSRVGKAPRHLSTQAAESQPQQQTELL